MRKIRFKVASENEVEEDLGKIVPLGEDGGTCALFRHQGRYYAVGSLCPHQNASLQDAQIDETGQVVCLRHGYRFDLKTGDCTTLGGYGLPTFETSVENGEVFVSFWEYD